MLSRTVRGTVCQLPTCIFTAEASACHHACTLAIRLPRLATQTPCLHARIAVPVLAMQRAVPCGLAPRQTPLLSQSLRCVSASPGSLFQQHQHRHRIAAAAHLRRPAQCSRRRRLALSNVASSTPARLQQQPPRQQLPASSGGGPGKQVRAVPAGCCMDGQQAARRCRTRTPAPWNTALDTAQHAAGSRQQAELCVQEPCLSSPRCAAAATCSRRGRRSCRCWDMRFRCCSFCSPRARSRTCSWSGAGSWGERRARAHARAPACWKADRVCACGAVLLGAANLPPAVGPER